MPPKRRLLARPARWLLFGLADAALALVLWTAGMHAATDGFRPAAAIGNTPGSLRALPARGPDDPFRFAVISDIEEGVETFREALRQFAARRPDFVVINGDLCYRPSPEGYRYFLWQFRDAPYAGPYFCGAGNHDLVGRTDPARFRAHFGPDRFAFRLGACQFLLVNNCVGGLGDADYAWIERAAADPGSGPAIRHRFLFIHYPPADVPKERDEIRLLPAYRRLYDLAPTLAVRRVFCGNRHAFRRRRIAGVDYVVCGGGGADLQSPGATPHYVEVTIEGDVVRDAVIPLPEIHSPIEEVDRFALLYVGPWLRRHPLAGIALGIGVLAVLAWQLAAAARLLARRRAAGPDAEALQSPPAT
jgi:3',5'-cyclic AMP phosphodiesterase CpdA